MLIISPYFPPSNAADMQRIRMSLPYFNAFGWKAEIVTVDEKFSDLAKDELLSESIPANTIVHKVGALSKGWTSKIGLGSIALRSIPFYRSKVNQLLKTGNYQLVYFSTTQFPVCTLGAYWKRKFKVPYVIDMQDPWHSDYYLDKPKEQRPPKYWFSYRLNKYLEPVAMGHADGLISVSEDYITTLNERYPQLKDKPAATITFGTFEPDLKIAAKNKYKFDQLLDPGSKNIVYIGRGGMDMHKAITPVFETFRKCLDEDLKKFSCLKFYFIGTSYAPASKGNFTILPLAEKYGVAANVTEIRERIGYYHTLTTLQSADALFVPGSDDPKYTASKIYPYLLIDKPLLTIFNSKSSVVKVLNEAGAKHNYTFDTTKNLDLYIRTFLTAVVGKAAEKPTYDKTALENYSAKTMTGRQCKLFNEVLNDHKN